MRGVVVLNAVLLVVGFCLLAPALRGRRPLAWVSWAGVALLLGAALVGLGLFLAAIFGATTGPWLFAVLAGLLAVLGLVASIVAPRGRLAPARPRARPRAGPLAEAVTTMSLAALAVLGIAILVGGFRSSPWLDDAWGIWLPKGIALSSLGLDERLFVPNGVYVHFEVPDYPLWWPALTGLEVRLAGDLDVRAMNAQLGIFAVAFLAAWARLLWSWVRPWLLCLSLLLLAASPEFLRHTQSGMADFPLAVFLSLSLLAGVGWLATGSVFYATLLAVFGAAAAAIKSEGLPEVVLLTICLGLFATRRRLGLWLAGAAAVVTAIPWLAWRGANDIGGRVALGDALDPGYLGDRAGRLGPGIRGLAAHLLDPSEWLLLVPIAVALSLAGFARERRAAWLALPALLTVGFAFLAWAYWADRDAIDYLVDTSAYRVVDPLLLTAALAVPLLGERLLAGREKERVEETAAAGQAGL
jgi:hypothetical protein